MHKLCIFWFRGRPVSRGMLIFMILLITGAIMKLIGYEELGYLVDIVSITIVSIITLV